MNKQKNEVALPWQSFKGVTGKAEGMAVSGTDCRSIGKMAWRFHFRFQEFQRVGRRDAPHGRCRDMMLGDSPPDRLKLGIARLLPNHCANPSLRAGEMDAAGPLGGGLIAPF